MEILTVPGSLQRRSANRALLDLLAEPLEGVRFVSALSLREVPHYDSDLEAAPPKAVQRWRSQLRSADAIVFASPEYGHGVSGVLKNALDWIVRSGELGDKPVAATCAAQGPERGRLGTAALVQTLRAIDARVVWSEPIVVLRSAVGEDGRIEADEPRAAGRALVAALRAAVEPPTAEG